MQKTIKPMIADWYNGAHFEDWQHEPLKAGEEYYLVNPNKRHIDVVSFDEIRTYLELDRKASENWVAYILDERYPGWSTETASGRNKNERN